MKRFVLILLLSVLLAATTFGLDLSLAPGLSVKNAFLYVILLAYMIETAVFRNRAFELRAVLVPFGIFVAYAMLSWFVASFVVQPDYYEPLGSAIALKGESVDHLILFLLFFYGVATAREALGLLRVFLWMVVLGNLLTVVDGFNIPDLGIVQQREDGRLGGPMGESNQYGAFLALTLPAVAALMWDSPHTNKVAATIACLISVVALLAASSRGSFVGLLVGSALAVLLLRSHISIRHVAVGTVVAGLGLVGVTIAFLSTDLFGDLVQRFLEKSSGDLTTVSSGRTAIWRLALERMIESPLSFLTGFGWDAYDNMRGFNAAPHNVYLAIMFNLGLPGLSLFLVLVFSLFAACIKALRRATGVVRTHLMAFVFGFSSLCISVAFVDLYQPWAFIWAYTGLIMRLVHVSISEAGAPSGASPRPLSLSAATRS